MSGFLLVICAFIAFLSNVEVNSQLVPAILTFGDSIVDAGNNNYLPTLFKANGFPYGRNFAGHRATGRFCNGKLASDFIADRLFFDAYAPAYLSPDAAGQNLLIGSNFASAGSGYDENTALLTGAISLPAQVAHFKEYKEKLARVTDNANASKIISEGLYLVSFGSTDFIMYYANPFLNKAYTPAQYSNYLTRIFSRYVKELYSLGARRIGVTSLPPLGCLPLVRTLFGEHKSGCVERINMDARGFNTILNSTANDLKHQLPNLKLVVFDIFTPLYNYTKYPADHGFRVINRGCCGTGTIETTVLLCNAVTPGTCETPARYIFWDSIHPTEATNRILADALILQGLELLS